MPSPSRTFDLDGRVALITGAAGGIGAATACLFAEHGARLVLSDINEEGGHRLADELRAQGREAVFVRTDVREEAQVEQAVDLAVKTFGQLDVMINNAGVVGALGPISQTPADQWHSTMRILLDSVFFGIKHAARPMMAQRSGCIISISSIAGVMGGQGPHAYTAAKHAVVGLSTSAASELAAYGIRVNAVAPGTTITPMVIGVRGGEEEALRYGASISPLNSPILPQEIAATMLFLATAGQHVTAQTLVVDSGVTGTSFVANEKYHSKPTSYFGPR